MMDCHAGMKFLAKSLRGVLEPISAVIGQKAGYTLDRWDGRVVAGGGHHKTVIDLPPLGTSSVVFTS
ncbi:hypothetical protein AOLI_G00083000 [Acnodon oligacanthus]